MKTYKQLINEVIRVRQSKVAFDSGVKTARWSGTPDTDTLKNPNFRAGYTTAMNMGPGVPADQGGTGPYGSSVAPSWAGKGQDALKFTRKERVTATEKMAARAAKGKQEAIAANANKRLNDQRERTTPQ
jgi:hypothetical protein